MESTVEEQPDIQRPQYNLHGNLRNNVKKPVTRPYANIGIVNQLYEDTNNKVDATKDIHDISESVNEQRNTESRDMQLEYGGNRANKQYYAAVGYTQDSPSSSNSESKPIPSPRHKRNRPQFFVGDNMDNPPVKPNIAAKPDFPIGETINMSSRPPESTHHSSVGNQSNISPNPSARSTNRPHFSLADAFNRPPSPISHSTNRPNFTTVGVANRPPSPVEAISSNRPKLSVAHTVNRPPSPLAGTVRRPPSPIGGTVNRTFSPITEGGSIRSYHSGGEAVSRSYSMPEKSLPNQNSLRDAPYPGAYMEGRYGAMPLDAPLLNPGEIPLTLPDDGCLLLGKEETSTGIKYVYSTRFYISSRREQRKHVTNQVLQEHLFPCCDPEYTSTCGGQLWGCLRSELFLFTLQVSALVLGLMKITIHFPEVDRDLHLTHAVLETSFACIFVIIKSFISKEKFHIIKEERLCNEYLKRPGDSRSTPIKIWVFLQFLVGFALCGAAVASFVMCYLYSQMAWIILSNQFIMLFSTFITSLTMARLSHMITRIKEDQHKIIIHESALLLGELYWSQTEQQRSKAKQHVERFCKGLKLSPSFYRPEYIKCPEDIDWDIVTYMESGV